MVFLPSICQTCAAVWNLHFKIQLGAKKPSLTSPGMLQWLLRRPAASVTIREGKRRSDDRSLPKGSPSCSATVVSVLTLEHAANGSSCQLLLHLGRYWFKLTLCIWINCLLCYWVNSTTKQVTFPTHFFILGKVLSHYCPIPNVTACVFLDWF